MCNSRYVYSCIPACANLCLPPSHKLGKLGKLRKKRLNPFIL